ncbi:hypothetical protein UFOVP730_32 [uncultured Caudovirales phage]|uniref:Uncharacterized protein n=1 Tax=uncultured Caudovirales phage TaxID=2100421 RepID=A0A6J5NV60_9CAUD|nr:hypothetical protein UFOVP730_32 [uncultured Caudovirales phage]
MDLYIEVDARTNDACITAEAHENFDYASWTFEYLIEEFLGDYNDDEGVRAIPLTQEEMNELGLVAAKLRAGADAITNFIRKNQAL